MCHCYVMAWQVCMCQYIFNNNTLDLYVCMTQLKQASKIEENICIKIKMIIDKTTMDGMHVIMYV